MASSGSVESKLQLPTLLDPAEATVVQIKSRYATDMVQIRYRYGTDMVQIWYRYSTDTPRR